MARKKKNLQTASPEKDRYTDFMNECRGAAVRLGIKNWQPSNLQTASQFRDVTEGKMLPGYK